MLRALLEDPKAFVLDKQGLWMPADIIDAKVHLFLFSKVFAQPDSKLSQIFALTPTLQEEINAIWKCKSEKQLTIVDLSTFLPPWVKEGDKSWDSTVNWIKPDCIIQVGKCIRLDHNADKPSTLHTQQPRDQMHHLLHYLNQVNHQTLREWELRGIVSTLRDIAFTMNIPEEHFIQAFASANWNWKTNDCTDIQFIAYFFQFSIHRRMFLIL